MDKVLIKLFLPKINKQYDVWIPLNKKIYNITTLLVKGINELNNGIYEPENIPVLYNRLTGENYDLNLAVGETDIENGTELILM